MPELPEVETLARRLRKTVVGKRIIRVTLSGLSLRRPVTAAFAAELRGRCIRKIIRRGKYLVFELDPKSYLLVHLGMSGRLLFGSGPSRRDAHTHAVFHFSDNSALAYRDPRRFGSLSVHDADRPDGIPELGGLGMDPLRSGFTGARLLSLLRKSRRDLKAFLLDQSKIAGLGNIYVCEALYLAGIHPARRCFTVNPGEAGRLAEAIRSVLRRAIRLRGTSFSDFIDLEGNPGKNQYYLNVFQRDGDACNGCGHPVLRIRQGGRSTFFCPNCQK